MITSAFNDFVPDIGDAYGMLCGSHHSSVYVGNCGGCRLAAEAVLQAAMRRWEWFVKEVIIDLMSGLKPLGSQGNSCRPKPLHANRMDARNNLLRTKVQYGTVRVVNNPQKYLLLHHPDTVVAVADHWVDDSTVSSVFRNYRNDILQIIKIRHGLAHGTRHAQVESNMQLRALDPLNTYSDVGEFLLNRAQPGVPIWLDRFLDSLTGWAMEMSP